MFSTLKSMDVVVADNHIAMVVFSGLSSGYESLIVALYALENGSNVFSFELVKSRLMQEEQRIMELSRYDGNPAY